MSDNGQPIAGASPEKWFSLLIGCYGDYPQYSLRAVKSVVCGRDVQAHCDVHVGLIACCRKTQRHCRRHYDRRRIDSLVETRHNINKNPMMRILLQRVTTPYFLWLDDDSHFVDSAWPALVTEFLRREHPLDAAGHVFFWNARYEADDPFWRFVSRKPWWKGDGQGRREADDTRIFFPSGGATLGRTAFFRQHQFPDYAMVKRQEDVVLGEMLNQQCGRLIDFPRPLMDAIRISDGDRRGSGESASDFLECDPRTGASSPVW